MAKCSQCITSSAVTTSPHAPSLIFQSIHHSTCIFTTAGFIPSMTSHADPLPSNTFHLSQQVYLHHHSFQSIYHSSTYSFATTHFSPLLKAAHEASTQLFPVHLSRHMQLHHISFQFIKNSEFVCIANISGPRKNSFFTSANPNHTEAHQVYAGTLAAQMPSNAF